MNENRERIKKENILVSVIIPAYNESQGISSTLEELISQVDLDETEIIVVNDGSTDNTAEIVRGFPEVRLIEHSINKGYGTAIQTGVRAAYGEVVSWYDADGQHRPEDLKKVVDEVKINDKDYCIGVRKKDSYEDRSRIFGKWILRMFIHIFIQEKVPDFNSGLRAFKRMILLRYLSYLPKRFGASTVTTLLMVQGRYNGSEVPIIVRKRIGKSSVRQVKDGFNTMILILNIVFLFQPIRLFGGAGAVVVCIGAVYGAICSIRWGTGLTVLSAVIILFGIQMVCFGMLSQQISRLWRDRMESLDEYMIGHKHTP